MNPSRIHTNRGLTLGGLVALVAIVGVLLVTLFMIKVRTVQGNQIGVLETFDGVSPNPLQPGMYWWANGIGKEVYTYPVSGRVFVMNDKSDAQEPFAEGRRTDSLVVNSLDNQRVTFHITVTWRIDPKSVVQLHKSYRDNIEERLIRPEVVNAVGIPATLQNAIDLYSGVKLNTLREAVTKELRDPAGKLALSGVLVDRFVIEKPKLNPDYEKVIEQRQLAIAQESQAREQKKANEAIAEAAKAAALKQQYETLVQAETAAKQQVIAQEADSQKQTIKTKADALNTITQQEAAAKVVVITAKAEADRQVAISEAAKQSEVNRAVGIEAVGRAEAEAKKLALTAFSVPGSELYTRVEVAKSFALAIDKTRFYPSNATFNTIAGDFDKGLSLLVGQGVVPVAK